MKKSTKSTIALAAAVLFLSGTFAAAAERVDASETTKSSVSRSLSKTKNTLDLAAGTIEDIDLTDPTGSELPEQPKCSQRSSLQSFIEPLICMITSGTGNSLCLRPEFDDDLGPDCQ